jgi:hypothetical protein
LFTIASKPGDGEQACITMFASAAIIQPQKQDMPDQELCPLCGRVLGDINIDRHHLVPKTFKGKEQYPIHRICHRKIHATFSERELLKTYHTWEALRGHEEIRAFIEWVAKKDSGYYSRTSTSRDRRKK